MRYMVSDGCTFQWPDVGGQIQSESLYKVSSNQALYHAGPHLIKNAPSELVKHNLGNASFIILEADDEFEMLYNFFRKFLIVQTEDIKQLYFRFYDPRVLRIFLPTCSPKQLEEFFGPVDHFICEDEDPEFAMYFSLSKGNLITERKPIKILFPEWDNDINQTASIVLPDSKEEPPTSEEDLQEDKEEKRQGRKFIY